MATIWPSFGAKIIEKVLGFQWFLPPAFSLFTSAILKEKYRERLGMSADCTVFSWMGYLCVTIFYGIPVFESFFSYVFNTEMNRKYLFYFNIAQNKTETCRMFHFIPKNWLYLRWLSPLMMSRCSYFLALGNCPENLMHCLSEDL